MVELTVSVSYVVDVATTAVVELVASATNVANVDASSSVEAALPILNDEIIYTKGGRVQGMLNSKNSVLVLWDAINNGECNW
jgi:hypothetical protein